MSMSKAVMISIQPTWCKLIANGIKTVEIRKTKPKLEAPFKCYIYCTQNTDILWILNKNVRTQFVPKIADIIKAKAVGDATKANGKVIGEFMCNFIYEFTEENQEFCGPSYDAIQLTPKELSDYANGKTVYGWHISDLIIYDEPKRISYFCSPCDKQHGCDCNYCKRHSGQKPITRPPQSWCYVEEAGE